MKFTTATAPQFANAERTLINLVVQFSGLNEAVPFTASPTDPEAHGRELFHRALDGQYGPVAAYVAPPPAPPSVPREVTMRQARLALLEGGLLAQVDAAINALPSPQREAARIEWEYSQSVQRQWPFVQALGAALSLDDAALDALFTRAAQL